MPAQQLPGDIGDFVGRIPELEKALRLLEYSEQKPEQTATEILNVCGMAGVGKSALAVHAAHRVKSLYSDAQLYVNLRGEENVSPEAFEILGGLIRALGVPATSSLPARLEDRIALYRSLAANKRILILLDNARDETQIRSLLPADIKNAVLITSRRRLAALAGASFIDLRIFGTEEAIELLGRLAGEERIQAEPKAAKDILELCGFLPLAVRIAGGTLGRSRIGDSVTLPPCLLWKKRD